VALLSARFFGKILPPKDGGDFFKNPKGLTLQDYNKSHNIFAVFSFMKLLPKTTCFNQWGMPIT
jgi:hypothetical protein